ncbi:MAG TPA: hypothetical protein VG406_08405 [Isosphaeraceae bacterium]|jgi:hypothetical protein|nr:hypothetical protein [Isosphaeraceae bacterium]
MRLHPLLDRLKGDEFDLAIGFLPAPAALRRLLQRSADVRRVAGALRYGAITEGMIREFVASIVAEFRPGRRLDDDLALAALAVVLELRPTDFAEEYLHDLARLELAEMGTSTAVARECLRCRYAVPKHEARSFVYPSVGPSPPRACWVPLPRDWGDERRGRRAARFPSREGAA